MIIYWKNHIAGKTGAHQILSKSFKLPQSISVTSAAATVTIIAQVRGVSRFVQTRVFGRIN